MCGRYMFNFDDEEIIKKYNIKKNNILDQFRGDIYPSGYAPIVVKDDDLSLEKAKWGFPLYKSKKLVINARSETLKKRSMFRESFNYSRCIVPANLFYEWKSSKEAKKTKYEIFFQDNEIMSLAGLYKYVKNDKDEDILSFTIITTKAYENMNNIHDRMPLIISDEYLTGWLDKNTSDENLSDIIDSNRYHELKIIEEEKMYEQLKLF